MNKEGVILTSSKAMYYYNLGLENYTKKDEKDLYSLISSSILHEEEARECWEVYVYYMYQKKNIRNLQVIKLPLPINKTLVREWDGGLEEANYILLKRQWDKVYSKWYGINLDEFERYYEYYKEFTGRELPLPLITVWVDRYGMDLKKYKEGKVKPKTDNLSEIIQKRVVSREYYTFESVIQDMRCKIEQAREDYTDKNGLVADLRSDDEWEFIIGYYQMVSIAISIQTGLENELRKKGYNKN